MNQATSRTGVGRLFAGITLLVVAVIGIGWALLSSGAAEDPVPAERPTIVGPTVAGDSPNRPVQELLLEEDDWVTRAERAVRWPIPEGLRLPGGPVDVALASTPEAWLLTLPLEQQPAAQAFLERNAEAYAFTSKAEQAWMIDNGFPSLEEAAFFAGLPRSQTCEKSVDDIRLGLSRPCSNPKLAALSSDAYLREVSVKVRSLGGDPNAVEVGDALAVAPAAIDAILIRSEAEALLVRESVGAYRFYQLARLERELASLSDEAGGSGDAALALAYACEGDARVAGARRPQLWENPAAHGAQLAVQLLGNDLRRSSGAPACGFSRHAFPENPR